jgi:hypothetical protein
LAEVDCIGLTTDGWTSRNNDPFQSLTLHYVDKNFNLKRCDLCYPDFLNADFMLPGLLFS